MVCSEKGSALDYRALECFVITAEELHFRRASARLNLTQPSLSARIKALEKEVGTQLLERTRRHVALTPAGRAFLDSARSAVANTTEALRSARMAASGEAGRLRFGFTGLSTFGDMPDLVQRFRSRFPAVEVELVHADTAKLETGLLTEEIDVALLHPPLEHDQFSRLDFPPEDLVLALPMSNELGRLEAIRMPLLSGQPLLLPPRRAGPHLYDQIIHLCRTEGGFSPWVVQEVATMTTLIGLAAAGLGCGFVLRSLDIIKHPGVAYRPLASKAPRVDTSLVWRKGRLSKVASNLVQIARVEMPHHRNGP